MDNWKKIGKLLALFFALLLGFAACRSKEGNEGTKIKTQVLKGLYSYGPEIKSFTDCRDEGREYWVADSSKNLELAYNNLGFEKPYIPVYIEVECHIVKSDTNSIYGDYDSTMVVTKVLKISKDIPDGPCNQ
ncbi:hypothetical protein [Pedobacter sp.]|uniref:hypothetical protein n=1 Tax=Pedobacter sp. TaxID=1411316 RepID=UPI00396CB03D